MQVDYHLSPEVPITKEVRAQLKRQATWVLEVRFPWDIVTWITITDAGWTFSAATRERP